jgi:hypothetical protein
MRRERRNPTSATLPYERRQAISFFTQRIKQTFGYE